MLFLYNPIKSLSSLDDVFDKSFLEFDMSPKLLLHGKRSLSSNNDDDEGSLRVTMDVPGVKESDIQVTIDQNVLKIRAETKNRRFQKMMTVDADRTDLSKLTAHLADGVLTVTAPPKAKPEAIQVTVTTNDVNLDDDEKENFVRRLIEIPGVKHSDLKVTFEEGTTLHVRGVRNGVDFDKTLRVDPDEVDVTKFTANLSHGVLSLEAPKLPKPQPQTLAIEAASADNDETNESTKDGASSVLVSMDLPGVRIKDVSVNTVQVDKHRSALDIQGSRNTTDKNKKLRISKTILVDHDTYDLDQMKAQLVDGVLTITAPKKPEAEPITIPIVAKEQPKDIEQSNEGAKSENE